MHTYTKERPPAAPYRPPEAGGAGGAPFTRQQPQKPRLAPSQPV